MWKSERPMGAAKGKPTNTTASCQAPPLSRVTSVVTVTTTVTVHDTVIVNVTLTVTVTATVTVTVTVTATVSPQTARCDMRPVTLSRIASPPPPPPPRPQLARFLLRTLDPPPLPRNVLSTAAPTALEPPVGDALEGKDLRGGPGSGWTGSWRRLPKRLGAVTVGHKCH